MKALYLLPPQSFDLIYGPDERRDIARAVTLLHPDALDPETARTRYDLLAEVEIIFSGWGAPILDTAFLESTPRLKAVFYGAGSIRGMVTEAFWKKNIPITSSWAANAIPVAEFTLAEILFSLKRGWTYAGKIKENRAYPSRFVVPGAYGSTVGIISLGMIGRRVCEYLRPFDVQVVAFDPYATADLAQQLGARLEDLSTVFRQADVVSLHTPWIKETEGLITGAHFESMKPGSTFINTARGAVVRETEMIEVLGRRPDLTAILDVTYPEPPAPGSPLYTLPNVILTPHIAGSMDHECRRMGRYVVDDLQRFLKGEPLKWQVSQELAARLA
jgi:phosphoglycerate dehydrogenase-like enzyme